MSYKSLKNTLLAIAVITSVSTVASAADDGPRMYWNGPVGLNIMQTYSWKINGNAIIPSGALFDRDASVDMDLADGIQSYL